MFFLIVLLCDQLFTFTAQSQFLKLCDSYLQHELLTRLPTDLPAATAVLSLLLVYWNTTTDVVWYSWIMPASQLYGTLTRKLYDIWRKASVFSVPSNAATGLLGPPNAATDSHRHMVTEIQQLFHGIDIYPTESQVYEMIQCASRCSLSRSHSVSSKATGDAKQCLTFGEFCYFASVLIDNYKKKIPPQPPLSQNDALNRKLERVQQSLHEGDELQSEATFEVFLGGSCNPTRWRTEIVIPEFKRLGITYYNPQVEEWGPELIELECYAKQHSEVLFFVIDNQTRAIASMIEVAFLAASGRKLILVINDLPGPKCKIAKDELSLDEYEMLSKGRAILRDVVERQGIPIFSSIEMAVKATHRVLHDKIWPQELTNESGVIPVKNGHLTLGDKMIKMFNLFNSLKNEKKQFTFAELAHAYRTHSGRVLPLEEVKRLARTHLANTGFDSNSSSPSLSRSSSSDEPEEEHFEVVPPAATANGKKLKSRSKKNRKIKRLSDFFPSDSSRDDPPLPPLNEIVIDFDQFCCIISELDELHRNKMANSDQAADVTDGDDRSVPAFPSKVLEKVNNQLFNVFSIIKAIFSIPVDEQQSKESSGLASDSHTGAWTPQVPSNAQHPLHPTRLHRAPSFISNSFPSRSSSPVPGYWSQADLYDPNTSSLARHSPLPHGGDHAQYASSYSVNAPSTPLGHHPHLRSHGHLARSASPNLFRHRHSVATPSPNHLAPHHHPLAGHHPFHHQTSHSPMRESPLPLLRRGFHSSTSSITSLLYDNYTDLYIGGCLEDSFLNQEIIPLLKKYSITFSTLKADRWTSQRMIPLEAKNIEKSRVLLFLITKDSIDISFMIMAAHYVGCRCKVVLCIQDIDSSSPFVSSNGKNETWLSTDAIKDHNRGRSYLSDLATKCSVSVFTDIHESIQCCIETILNEHN